jgi:hypothetical protein
MRNRLWEDWDTDIGSESVGGGGECCHKICLPRSIAMDGVNCGILTRWFGKVAALLHEENITLKFWRQRCHTTV